MSYSKGDAAREPPLEHVQLSCDCADGGPACQLAWGEEVGCPGVTGRVARSACHVCPHAFCPSLILQVPRFMCQVDGFRYSWLQIKYNFEICLVFLKKHSISISRLSQRDLCHQHGWAVYCMLRWKGRGWGTCLLKLGCVSVLGSTGPTISSSSPLLVRRLLDLHCESRDGHAFGLILSYTSGFLVLQLVDSKAVTSWLYKISNEPYVYVCM